MIWLKSSIVKPEATANWSASVLGGGAAAFASRPTPQSSINGRGTLTLLTAPDLACYGAMISVVLSSDPASWAGDGFAHPNTGRVPSMYTEEINASRKKEGCPLMSQCPHEAPKS